MAVVDAVMSSLLGVHRVSKRWGGISALADVDLDVGQGSITGLIGPNGSGKTTLINVIAGVYPPTEGTVEFDGSAITGMKPYDLVGQGISRTFQTARVFKTLTVWQNMLVPVLHSDEDPFDLSNRAGELLEFVSLSDYRDTAASELSGGQQRLLEFARSLMTNPKLVLMDEPFAGVHPHIKKSLVASVRSRREAGTAFLVVSHEIPVITGLVDELVCLANGKVIARGSATSVVEAPAVAEAYLGHSRHGGDG
jgi:ABC-type branched-subunit amino acid transport system ATPase component